MCGADSLCSVFRGERWFLLKGDAALWFPGMCVRSESFMALQKSLNFAGQACGSGIEPQAAVAAGMRAAAVGSLTPTHSQHLAAFNAELDRIAVDLRVQQRAGACDRP